MTTPTCRDGVHEEIDLAEPNPDSTRLVPYCTHCGASGEALYPQDLEPSFGPFFPPPPGENPYGYDEPPF